MLDTIITDESGINLTEFMSYGHDPDQGSVMLTIKTLNPGDTFTVQMIVDGENPTGITVSGRIEDQTRKSMIQPTKAQFDDIKGSARGGTLWFVIAGGLGTYTLLATQRPSAVIFGWIAIGIAVVFLVVGWVSAFRKHRALYAPKDSD